MTCGSTQSGGCNKNPASFPAGQVRGLREQRELRTADRVLILRQRSASGKTPGGPATASAKKARRMAGGQVCLSDRQKSGPSPTCLATSCPVNSPKMGSAIGRVQKENAAAVPLARCAVVRRRCALGHRRAANFCANQCGVQSAARRMPFTLCPAAAAPPSHEKAPPARVSRRGSALSNCAGRPSFGGVPPLAILRPPYASWLVKKAGQSVPLSFSSPSASRSLTVEASS